MFKENEYVIYKREVCIIKEIKEKYVKDLDYFVLSPINDSTLKIQVPINNPSIKPLITKEEIEELIKNIPNIEIIKVDDKLLETEYKKCMKTETHEDLIRIIKTTYLRNKERIDNHKKVGDKDNNYLNLAEKYLYTELSFVLDKTIEETKEYMIERLSK